MFIHYSALTLLSFPPKERAACSSVVGRVERMFALARLIQIAINKFPRFKNSNSLISCYF